MNNNYKASENCEKNWKIKCIIIDNFEDKGWIVAKIGD